MNHNFFADTCTRRVPIFIACSVMSMWFINMWFIIGLFEQRFTLPHAGNFCCLEGIRTSNFFCAGGIDVLWKDQFQISIHIYWNLSDGDKNCISRASSVLNVEGP